MSKEALPIAAKEPKRIRQLRALREVLQAQQAAMLSINEYLRASPALSSATEPIKEAGRKLAKFMLETEGDLEL